MRQDEALVLVGEAKRAHQVVKLTIASEYEGLGAFAQPSSRLDEGSEDGLQIAGGAADGAQHVGRCGELVDRARELRLALAQLFEEAGILPPDPPPGRRQWGELA